MKYLSFIGWLLLGSLLLTGAARASEPFNGWRGNGTGLFPSAKPPLAWERIARGALEGLRVSATRPMEAGPGTAARVEKGLIRDWLVLGPFPVKDSVQDFDRDCLGGEANVEPAPEKKIGELQWTSLTVPPDDIMVFGTAELPWLDLAKKFGFQRNQLGYAHTWLHSPRGGKAIIVVDHGQGLKAWVNGKQVYRAPQRGMALGAYTALSRIEFNHLDHQSPRFDLDLKPGWNHLLLKLSTSNLVGHTDMRCALRIIDPPDVKYDSRNIRWMTPLPARSTSTPILVGERLFVLAEPDELLCLDSKTGRILWSAAVNYYEALTPDERRANPAYAKRIVPLVAKLRAETERRHRVRLRAEIQKALLAIDADRFKIAGNDHFEAHFGIVGFTMPTPVSDGKHVFVWSGMGVAACFDLDGQRQWITRVKTESLTYGSSPALVDGVLAVFLNQLHGLDAKTGKLLWQQRKIRYNVASLLATRFNGQAVFVTQRGDIVRPADGEVLLRQRGSGDSGDTGWSPPVVLGERLYLPKYGVTSLSVWDFSKVGPKDWDVKPVSQIGLPQEVSLLPGGKWIDRWTAGSPLIWEGLSYQTDIYQMLYVVDLKSGKMLYRRGMELQGFTHYNAVAVAASPTLVGKHVVVVDNQGTALVLEPGPAYKVVARNHIGTQLDRNVPIPAQETLCYAPPLADGDRLYLRGEAYLYCIGPERR